MPAVRLIEIYRTAEEIGVKASHLAYFWPARGAATSAAGERIGTSLQLEVA